MHTWASAYNKPGGRHAEHSSPEVLHLFHETNLCQGQGKVRAHRVAVRTVLKTDRGSIECCIDYGKRRAGCRNQFRILDLGRREAGSRQLFEEPFLEGIRQIGHRPSALRVLAKGLTWPMLFPGAWPCGKTSGERSPPWSSSVS